MASKFSLRRALISAGFALGATGVAVGTAALASDPGFGGAQTLQYSYRASLSDSDARTLGAALEAAKRGDPGAGRARRWASSPIRWRARSRSGRWSRPAPTA